MTDMYISKDSAQHWQNLHGLIKDYIKNDYIDVITSIASNYISHLDDKTSFDLFMYLAEYLELNTCSQKFFDYPEVYNQCLVNRIKSCIDNLQANADYSHKEYIEKGLTFLHHISIYK